MDCKNSNCIQGIKCEVTNCHYHTKDNHCTAGVIEVGNMNATEKGDTQCKTFKTCC
ncbi:MAG: DUF1540 domain-containing protein [Clostridia bacterium]|nr:DUF1540 domain-containing protein [Clostridia bacterium]